MTPKREAEEVLTGVIISAASEYRQDSGEESSRKRDRETMNEWPAGATASVIAGGRLAGDGQRGGRSARQLAFSR